MQGKWVWGARGAGGWSRLSGAIWSVSACVVFQLGRSKQHWKRGVLVVSQMRLNAANRANAAVVIMVLWYELYYYGIIV